MAIYKLLKQQFLKTNKAALWDFISSPKNLQEITPQEMGFVITSDFFREKMYTGQIITYKVSPLLGIKLNWCTEITHVDEGKYFIDEQRFGPYSMWHHEHHLEEQDGGVLMTDVIHYKVPFGGLGDIANSLFVKKQLEKIFAHRFDALEKKFNQS